MLDDRQTGETILDEALRMMKGQEQEKMAVNSWIDLLSGESPLPGRQPARRATSARDLRDPG